MSKEALEKIIRENTGCLLTESKTTADAIVAFIIERLRNHTNVTFHNLGTLHVVHLKRKKLFSPLMSERKILPPRFSINFRIAKEMRLRLNPKKPTTTGKANTARKKPAK